MEVGLFHTTTRLFNGSGELNEPQQFGEPYLLSTNMYDIINAIGRVASPYRRLHKHADGRDLVRPAALGMTTSQLGHPAASGKSLGVDQCQFPDVAGLSDFAISRGGCSIASRSGGCRIWNDLLSTLSNCKMLIGRAPE
jgi:hypothetical protein